MSMGDDLVTRRIDELGIGPSAKASQLTFERLRQRNDAMITIHDEVISAFANAIYSADLKPPPTTIVASDDFIAALHKAMEPEFKPPQLGDLFPALVWKKKK